MKRRLAGFMALVLSLSLLLISCDFTEEAEDFSNDLKDIALENMGDYFKETEETSTKEETSEETSEQTSEETSEESSSEETSEESSSEETSEDTSEESSEESSSEEPEPEPEPEDPTPKREPSSVDMIIGINDSNFYEFGDGILNSNAFGFLRYVDKTNPGLDATDEGTVISRFYFAGKTTYLSMAVDLATVSAEGSSSTLSYATIAKLAYQYQKEYKNSFSHNLHKIEIGDNVDEKMDAENYADLLNAVFDGNSGALGTDYGVNNADSESRLMLGTLSTPNLSYVQNVMKKIEETRGGDLFVVRGISTKAYSSLAPQLAYSDSSDLFSLVNYRDTNYPYMELHVSEFGYNTVDTTSSYYVSEATQANYLVQAYSIFASYGIDSASIPTYKDVSGEATNGFGIQREDGTFKPSYYYLSTMRTALEGYLPTDEELIVPNGVYAYGFANGENTAFVCWTNGESIGTEFIEGFQTIEFADGDEDGVTTDYIDGTITFTEKPIIIVLSNATQG